MSSFLLANITNFSDPPPLAERAEGQCKLTLLLLAALFSITDLDMMYFLRKIFPPSEILEVCMYSPLQSFLRSDSDHLDLLES